jgi:hypothetical protein
MAVATVLATLAIPALAADPPRTTITAGPNGESYETSPTFQFASDVPDSVFECSLDGAEFERCSSPLKLGQLALGSHAFTVRAVAPDGQVDPAPPVRNWDVVPPLDTPVVKLKQPARRTLRRSQLRTISGTAAAPAGVTRVQVSLQRGGPDKSVFPPRCTFFDMRTATKTLQPCILPAYFAAKGTVNWRYTSAKAGRGVLTPGKYTLIVRAFNPYGEASQTRFKLTLR